MSHSDCLLFPIVSVWFVGVLLGYLAGGEDRSGVGCVGVVLDGGYQGLGVVVGLAAMWCRVCEGGVVVGVCAIFFRVG